MKKNIYPILLGVLSAFFFSLTFILNELMAVHKSYWVWSGTLRYLWMLPMLIIVLILQRKNFYPIWQTLSNNYFQWIIWSNVGFVGFYMPMVFAANYLPGWIVSSVWQLTIIFGVLTTPLIKVKQIVNGEETVVRAKIPIDSLPWLVIILIGVGLTIIGEKSNSINISEFFVSLLSLIFASIAYPLGNRKIMPLATKLSGVQRVFSMVLCSYPTFLILSLFAYFKFGWPSSNTLLNTFCVAVFSGVIATVLFFKATSLVYYNMQSLAQVEATQSLEVVFSILLSLLFLGQELPSLWQWLGVLTLLFGILMINIRIQ